MHVRTFCDWGFGDLYSFHELIDFYIEYKDMKMKLLFLSEESSGLRVI